MKKILLLLVFCTSMVFADTPAQSQPEEVSLSVCYVDPTSDVGELLPRGPVMLPRIAISDYDLYFIIPCTGCTLRVIDNEANVWYNCVIPEGISTLSLPSFLTGSYQLQIIRGCFCFYGTISF